MIIENIFEGLVLVTLGVSLLIMMIFTLLIIIYSIRKFIIDLWHDSPYNRVRKKERK